MTDENTIVPEGEGPPAVAPESQGVSEPVPPPPPPPAPELPIVPPVEVVPESLPVSDSDKLLAILSYVFVIVAVVALLIDPYKRNPFVRLNAVQAIALWAIGLLWWIPVLGWILGLVAFVLAIVAIVKAFSGEYYKIPVVYDVVKGFVEQ